MTPEQFAYWLQGFAELNEKAPTQDQWDSIRAHIALVFKKETPPMKFLESTKDLVESIREFHRMQPSPNWINQVTC